MNNARRDDGVELSEAGRRRKQEILGTLGTELTKSVRRRRTARAAAASGGIAACGVGVLVALRVLGTAPGGVPSGSGVPVAAGDVAAPATVVSESAEPAIPAMHMQSARFEVIAHRPELAEEWRVSDEELLALVAQAGHSASIIRLRSELQEGRVIVIDNQSGRPVASDSPDPDPEPAGQSGDAESQNGRRAV